jgi:large subunit ribosomal protein L21
MFAVIKTGGKQYRVAAGDTIVVEKLEGEGQVAFDQVLMLADGGDVLVGAPTVAGAKVIGELVETRKGDKVKVFKKRRRNTYRRKAGHRQLETEVKITAVLKAGQAAPAPASKTATPGKDDLKDISGVGPALEKKLQAQGVKSLKDIAAMTDAKLAALGEAIGQGDRPVREEWAEQAKELLAGKPPRAKSDREAKAKRDGE